MSISVIAFAVMTALTVLFAAAALILESGFQLSALTQTGDSSLSPQSVNWLAGTASIGAVLICLVLI